ncbi:MAG: C-GCAxxG-C-C family protein [Clostridia bacterium]|nr:C-GCAxxG-C-C family protein [Clostridia bacterium]
MNYSSTDPNGILRTDAAVNYFNEGFNCSQSVALAFCDLFDTEPSVMLKIASSFGGGFGRMREICGACSGMAIIIGLATGTDDPKDRTQKSNNYAVVQKALSLFEKENGSYICKKLLGLDKAEGSPIAEERTPEYYKKRPCAELVRSAATILDTILKEI